MKEVHLKLVALWCVLLIACSGGGAYLVGPQHWNNVSFIVEVRPGPPRAGMNEFIIIATDDQRRPAFNYIVSIKMSSTQNWTQSIQDGHSGAYRRAIHVNNPQTDILMVKIKSKAGEEKILEFALNKATTGKT